VERQGSLPMEPWWGDDVWAGLTARSIERDDDAYYAPLDDLRIGEAELYLGLVHREDGVDGAERRITVAKRHVGAFGVATECGIGRAPAGTTEGILRTHAEVASAR